MCRSVSESISDHFSSSITIISARLSPSEQINNYKTNYVIIIIICVMRIKRKYVENVICVYAREKKNELIIIN